MTKDAKSIKKPNKKKMLLVTIPAVCIAIITIVIVTIVVVRSNQSYRIIKLEEYEGNVEVKRNKGLLDLFTGLQLISGDVSTTGENSAMTLLIDSDKHMSVTPNTVFEIKASGTEEKGSLKIDIQKGKAFFEVDNKLNNSSSFEVNTPNATTSIRGTQFLTSYDPVNNETHVFVEIGTVTVSYGDNQTVDVNEGESVTIKDDTMLKESTAVASILLVYDYQQPDYYNYITDYRVSLDEGGQTYRAGTDFDCPKAFSQDSLIIHQDTLNEYFEANKGDKDNWYRLKNSPNVTSWFPETVILDYGDGKKKYKVEKATIPSIVYNESEKEYLPSKVYTVEPTSYINDVGVEKWNYPVGVGLRINLLPMGLVDESDKEVDGSLFPDTYTDEFDEFVHRQTGTHLVAIGGYDSAGKFTGYGNFTGNYDANDNLIGYILDNGSGWTKKMEYDASTKTMTVTEGMDDYYSEDEESRIIKTISVYSTLGYPKDYTERFIGGFGTVLAYDWLFEDMFEKAYYGLIIKSLKNYSPSGRLIDDVKYDSNGVKIDEMAPNQYGPVTYDEFGRILQFDYSLYNVWRFAYNADGNLTEIINEDPTGGIGNLPSPNNTKAYLEYNQDGKLVKYSYNRWDTDYYEVSFEYSDGGKVCKHGSERGGLIVYLYE